LERPSVASSQPPSHEQRAQVRPVTAGIPWLGFVVYPSHRRVKRRNALNYRRRLRRLLRDHELGRISFGELQASIRGWVEHVRYADTWGLRREVLGAVRVRPRATPVNNRSKRR
jgi:hypothetical protein